MSQYELASPGNHGLLDMQMGTGTSEDWLRDQFAMAALTGIISSGIFPAEEVANGIRAGGPEAKCAYIFADAMIEARKR